jgi:two-component system, chemotaxis family, protein-glutamate methylesterase/glutaminase
MRSAPPPGDGRPRRVIAIGASAGGVDALRALVRALPADLPAAVCVVLHIPPTGGSLLAPILDRVTDLRVEVAEHGTVPRAGHVYVAPADRHLLIGEHGLELSAGPRENGVRPAVDPLFRSLARTHGRRAVAVVLSGALDDGSAGAVTVAAGGGTVVVQDPADAVVPGMPESAVSADSPEHVLPLAGMADLLARVVAEPDDDDDDGRDGPMAPHDDPPDPETFQRPSGPPSALTCPECRGPLWEITEGALTRYRCRVGHAYSEETLIAEHAAGVEAALWSAVEVLEERAELLRRVAARMGPSKPGAVNRLEQGARDAINKATLIRGVLVSPTDPLDTGVEAREAG